MYIFVVGYTICGLLNVYQYQLSERLEKFKRQLLKMYPIIIHIFYTLFVQGDYVLFYVILWIYLLRRKSIISHYDDWNS